MNFKQLLVDLKKTTIVNSPHILAGAGILGVVTTAYLSGKASYRAAQKIADYESSYSRPDRLSDRVREYAPFLWTDYAPVGISAAMTVGCIYAGHKVSTNRTVAALGAYSLSERALSEYQKKVREEFGEAADEKIRSSIAQDKISNTETPIAIVGGSGPVLCCELLSGRYFKSSMEELRKAQNDINAKIISDRYVNLDEFYECVGLQYTSQSNSYGWDSNKLMELEFSTTLTSDGVPCLAFDYSYLKPI